MSFTKYFVLRRSDSIGIDGSFTLRNQLGIGRSQLVTEEVFQRYEVGQYFNDLQPGSLSPSVRGLDANRRENRVPLAQKIIPTGGLVC